VDDRFELIRNLKRKYGDTIASILGYLSKAESQLEELGSYEERENDLQERHTLLKSEMGELAARLSKSRKEAAQKLVGVVQNELAELNMSGVIFDISINQSPSQDGLLYPDGNCYAFNRDGADMVEFRTSTNPGEPLKPLEIIASTGEMSRFMLALKSALAEADRIPVLIFDEIDIGVGGRSGDVVGKKLWRLACGRQAICVTHLPQIGAFADSHFSVQKIATGERTMSIIEKLDDNEHLNEMAVMLAGPNYTEATRQSASELIKEAVLWKQAQSKDT
jgi:DNA repair protein RecN (Recombination protein N)